MYSPDDIYLKSTQVRTRYGDISDMTLFRWLRDPELAFPQPEYIRGRRFWRLHALEAYDSARASKHEAA
ncbi:transcriptional regulator [Bradyrhizobium sp. 4]|uniref:DNA-binding protein n=1 Tax=unclassified Bradyrhizobium TaxID=2631580 RepID=UPI001FF90007|nr:MULTISPECIES: DNA-binding protein [unclassified Bradyrhizobium]MCK1402775.1 transcriptional regulator [Bradyrhizobium sp. 39]MCK1748370.1 transcriptional regulator [Bradyrhizobium sp. 135]UPJ32842.1 transcriptional regulator [Bradyrhizobium sp. 4]